MERPPRRAKADAGRWLALACIIVLLAPVVVDARLEPQDLRLPRPFKSGDDISKALGRQQHERMVSVFTGLASREVAHGSLGEMAVPASLDDIADRKPDYFQDEARPAFSETLMRQSSGARIVREDYEVILTPEQLASLDEHYERLEFPSDVVAFIGNDPEDRVYLHTDAQRRRVYVVPASAAERWGR